MCSNCCLSLRCGVSVIFFFLRHKIPFIMTTNSTSPSIVSPHVPCRWINIFSHVATPFPVAGRCVSINNHLITLIQHPDITDIQCTIQHTMMGHIVLRTDNLFQPDSAARWKFVTWRLNGGLQIRYAWFRVAYHNFIPVKRANC